MSSYKVTWYKWTRYESLLQASSAEIAQKLIEDLAEEAGSSRIKGEAIDVQRIEDVS